MIPRKLRLPIGRNQMRGAEAVSTPYFVAKISPNNLAHNRYAVVAGVKVSKSAVMRHLAKREILRECASWPQDSSRDVLVIVSPRLGALPKTQVRAALRESLAPLRAAVLR